MDHQRNITNNGLHDLFIIFIGKLPIVYLNSWINLFKCFKSLYKILPSVIYTPKFKSYPRYTATAAKITNYKNKRLAEGSKEIEEKVEKIVSKAKEDGAKLTKKKFDQTDVTKLVKGFFNSL